MEGRSGEDAVLRETSFERLSGEEAGGLPDTPFTLGTAGTLVAASGKPPYVYARQASPLDAKSIKGTLISYHTQAASAASPPPPQEKGFTKLDE